MTNQTFDPATAARPIALAMTAPVEMLSAEAAPTAGSGVLAYIEVEALSDGKFDIEFDPDITAFITSDGKSFAVKY